MYALSYTSKDINLNKAEFNRWVKPQLRSIRNDYAQLLTMVNSDLKKIKPAFSHFVAIKKEQNDFIKYCSIKKNDDCLKSIRFIQQRIENILSLFEEQELTNDYMANQPNELLRSFSEFVKFKQDLIDLYMEFFNYNFYYQSEMQSHLSAEILVSRLSQANNFFNVYTISTLNKDYSLSFLELWNGYIKPIDNLLVFAAEYTQFVRLLNQLNLRWNNFNVDLTKRNVKLPKQTQSLLNTMHNRWNSILKVTLR